MKRALKNLLDPFISIGMGFNPFINKTDQMPALAIKNPRLYQTGIFQSISSPASQNVSPEPLSASLSKPSAAQLSGSLSFGLSALRGLP